jgi:hypothetical protein
MMAASRRRLESPDKVRSAGQGQDEIMKFGDVSFERITRQPGWNGLRRKSRIVMTDSCQAQHLGYMFSWPHARGDGRRIRTRR